MSMFCNRNRNEGRRKLLNIIREHFDSIAMYPESYLQAVRFHRQLSTLYNIKEIITTNWDDLFERECAAVPFISPEDFVFWNSETRRVLKLHGSVTNYGSIIATEEDYKKCYRHLQRNVIGGYLKTLLATKTILFVGYSFGDEDFNRIYKLLKSDMKGLTPKAYIVTTDEDSKKRFEGMNLTTIITDASYFLEELKKIETAKGNLIPEKRFAVIQEANAAVKSAIDKLNSTSNIKQTPSLVFTTFYCDGLLHSFGMIRNGKKSGKFSDKRYVINVLKHVYKHRKEAAKKKNYEGLAYLDGFINGMHFFLEAKQNIRNLRIYYLFGCRKTIRNYQEYMKLSKDAAIMHKTAYAQAIKIANSSKEILYYHCRPSIFPRNMLSESQN
ncbi:SIR2-like domain protein [Candidatus Anstonella stagnisolia]|nr:SIR2-like domain protein [Candidatus Anstonella stagnisolia]